MKFIILFAVFAAAASAETQRENDRFLISIVGAILDHMKPINPVIVDPAITEPLVPTPVAVVDNYEQISVGPAIVDVPIDASPVIVPPSPPVPATPIVLFPVFSGPLVHMTLNVNEPQPGAAAAAGSPVGIDRPIPSPGMVEESTPVEESPIVVVEAESEPVHVAEPIVVEPVITIPDDLN